VNNSLAVIFKRFVARKLDREIFTFLKSWKFQAPKAKYQMVRQTHHPEPSRRANFQ
jgi:hypothetical protein